MTTITDDPTSTTATAAPIHPAELAHLLATDPETRILDVRTPGEFETAHIEGSFNVPLDLLGEQVRHVADVHHPIVLVCQSGARATTAHETLHSAGKTNLRVLAGGMGAWLADGGDVVRGEPRWAIERQVRAVAGGIVLVATLASLAAPNLRVVAGAVGAGLVVSALTDTCTMGRVLGKLPYNRGPKCDLDAVLRDLHVPVAA